MNKLRLIFISVLAFSLIGCAAREFSRAIEPQSTHASYRYHGKSISVALGKIENRSHYMNGVFYTDNNQLSMQAKQILTNHLTQAGCYNVKDRLNLTEGATEARYLGKKVRVSGANYIISGVVTEFGRRTTGNSSSIFAKSKKQIMYAKFSLSLIRSTDSSVVATASGSGEVGLSTKQVLGFGSKAGYDSTLADKVLDLAIREAVDRLTENLEGRGIL